MAKLDSISTDLSDKNLSRLRLKLSLHFKAKGKDKEQLYEVPDFLEDRLKLDERKTADKFSEMNKKYIAIMSV